MNPFVSTIDQLRDFVGRAQRALEALEKLQNALLIPDGTVTRPASPGNASIKSSKLVSSKECKCCRHAKPLTAFPKNKKCGDGYEGTCRACRAEQARKRLIANKATADKRPMLPESDPEPDRKFKCDICHAAFRYASTLAEHNKIGHAG